MRTARLPLILISALITGAALAQPTPAPGPGPWDRDILPPAPTWSGASEQRVAPAGDPWITPVERSGFARTATYDEVQAYLQRLDRASPLIRLEVIGRSAEGREIVAAIASRSPRRDPRRPLVLAQGGIHAGEIDGADASLMLLRDIAVRGRSELIADVDLMVVPVFNVDGHARVSRFSRPNQRGPELQGWRTTAQNLNLNRDYGKLDSPEMRAMVALLRRVDPDLYLDLHVTDGTDYQYDITWGSNGYAGGHAYSPNIARWIDQTFNPAVTTGLRAAGHIPGPLVFAVDNRDPHRALTEGPSGLRLSHGYGDVAHIPTVLIENHSLKPYRQRVLGSYVFLEQSLHVVAQRGAALRAAREADRAARPAELPANFQPDTAPTRLGEPLPVANRTREYLPIAYETYVSSASGMREVRWLGRPDPAIQIPMIGSSPALRLTRPRAYWVPASHAEVIERLRLHGVRMETLAVPRTVELDMFRAMNPTLAPVASEGRIGVRAERFTRERRRETLPAGSVRVPTDQPLGDLAMLLLEPESGESLFAWGFFTGMLQRTEYIEGYAIAPLAQRMLAADPALRREFEARLAADAAFRADPDARLSWFYERTPYFDDRWRLYPVGRELP